MKYVLLSLTFITLTVLSFHAIGLETETTIGKWKHRSGSVKFSIREENGHKSVTMFVSDQHVIETNYFSLSKAELENLKALIDQTLLQI